MGNRPSRSMSRYLIDPLRGGERRRSSEVSPRRRGKFSLASGLAAAALQENELQLSNKLRKTLVWTICLLSQLGLVVSVFATLQLTKATDTAGQVWAINNPNGWVRFSVFILPSSTLACILLILKYYHSEGERKVMEWQSEMAEFHFWRSSLPLACLGEVAMHVAQPYPGMNVNQIRCGVLQALMMLRVYTAFRPVVQLYKELFLQRVQHNKGSFALHMMFYKHTYTLLVLITVISMLSTSFLTFIFERTATPAFEKLSNIWWFAFVTSTSIGYGDMFPVTVGGRLMTVIMGLLSVVIVNAFTGVLTNKLAPTKEMLQQIEAERKEHAMKNLRNAAAQLIKATWLDSKGRKSNYYKALKTFRQRRNEMKQRQRAQDPVVEERLGALINRVEKVETNLRNYYADLKAVRGALEQVLLVSNALLDQDNEAEL